MQSGRGNSGASAPHTSGYRIDKSGFRDKPWVIRFDESDIIPLGLFRYDSSSAYPTRRMAFAAAAHLEVLRERRIKFVRHVVLATLWAVAAVGAYIVMATPEQAFQVEWFAIALAAAFFCLNETLEGFLVVIDEGWDRFYEIRSVSRVDRLVAGVVFLPFIRARRPENDVDSVAVRVVDSS